MSLRGDQESTFGRGMRHTVYLEGRCLLADVRHVAEYLERRASEALSTVEG